MAEKVKLFEVDIDLDSAIKDSVKFQKNVAELRKQIKELKEAEGDNTEEIARLTNQMKVEADQLRQNENLTKNITKAKRAESGQIERMRAELAAVSIRWAKLSEEEQANEKVGGRLAKRKLELTEALKKEEKATGDTRRNVGNYKDDVQDATSALDSFVPGVGGAGQAVQKFGLAVKVGLGPIGLLITAIGLIVGGLKSFFTSSEEGQNKLKEFQAIFDVVFGNIIDLLSEFGKRLLEPKKAIEDLRDFMKNTVGKVLVGIFGGAVARIEGYFNNLGLKWQELKGVFTDNAQGIADAQDKVNASAEKVNAMNKLLAEGIDKVKETYIDATKAIKELNEESLREIEIAKRLAAQQAALDVQIRDNLVQEAKDRERIAELRKQNADRERFTAQERVGFLEEAIKLEQQIADRNVDIAKQKYEIQKAQNQLSNSTKEDLEAEANLLAASINAQTAATQKQVELQSQLTSAKTQARAEIKAIDDAEDAEALADIDEDIAREEAELQRIKDNALREADAKQEARLLDSENAFILAENDMFARIELQRQELEVQKRNEIQYAKSIGADVEKVNKKYKNAELAIERQVQNQKIQMLYSTAAAVAAIMGQNTAAGKAAGIAMATINTYQGITEVWASKSLLPDPFRTIDKIASTIVVAKSGYDAVKGIMSTDTSGVGSISAPSVSASSPSIPSSTGGTGGSLRGQGVNVSAEVGNGLISRSIADSAQDSIVMQPTLVTDDVTVSQSEEATNTRTRAL